MGLLNSRALGEPPTRGFEGVLEGKFLMSCGVTFLPELLSFAAEDVFESSPSKSFFSGFLTGVTGGCGEEFLAGTSSQVRCLSVLTESIGCRGFEVSP